MTIKELIDIKKWNPNRPLIATLYVEGQVVCLVTAFIDSDSKGSFHVPNTESITEESYEHAELDISDFKLGFTPISERLRITNARRCNVPDPNHWHFHMEWPQSITIAASAAVP